MKERPIMHTIGCLYHNCVFAVCHFTFSLTLFYYPSSLFFFSTSTFRCSLPSLNLNFPLFLLFSSNLHLLPYFSQR